MPSALRRLLSFLASSTAKINAKDRRLLSFFFRFLLLQPLKQMQKNETLHYVFVVLIKKRQQITNFGFHSGGLKLPTESQRSKFGFHSGYQLTKKQERGLIYFSFVGFLFMDNIFMYFSVN